MGGIYTTILGEFLKAGFSEECSKLTKCLVRSSIITFNRIGKELLPTPAKSHYTFNLRDLGKVFQGMLMTVPASIKTGEQLARLWVHESQRVYQDRLISSEDVKWFDDVCEELVTEEMPGLEWADVMPARDALIFCDFLQPGADPLIYEEAEDTAKVFSRIDEELIEYNAEMDMQMHLVMFIDAVRDTYSEVLVLCARAVLVTRGAHSFVAVFGSFSDFLFSPLSTGEARVSDQPRDSPAAG
jgi:dynein heavy chain